MTEGETSERKPEARLREEKEAQRSDGGREFAHRNGQMISIVFCGDMCGTKNSSHGATVRPTGVQEAECNPLSKKVR